MDIASFDYDLPAELIAQYPADRRDASRLLALNRSSGGITHYQFSDIVSLLRPTDCLVLNDTRVIRARLRGKKEDGGADIELVVLRPLAGDRWEVLANRARRLRVGSRVRIADDLVAVVGERFPGGRFAVTFEADGDAEVAMARYGAVPLPPYIRRAPARLDEERYQTVYAQRPGSAAAPTAGLHFTEALLAAIAAQGTRIVRLTLHIGLDTFKPMMVERVEDHVMHSEWYELSAEAAALINAARAAGGRVVAVGTTSVRALESAASEDGVLIAGARDTRLYIYPGYRFRVVDALVTNFHLPRSTLLLLVSAFAGVERLRAAYHAAVAARYRFYSYGDAMWIA